MIRILAILFLVATTACAGPIVFTWKAPGAGGMVTNVDGVDLDPQYATWLYNVDLSRYGVLQKRAKIESWGFNTTAIYSAFGYWHPYTNRKNLVTAFNGGFGITDTNGIVVNADTIGAHMPPYYSAYHDWTAAQEALAHADGKTTVTLITTEGTAQAGNDEQDTSTYTPRVLDLGMAAPGQPIVGLVPDGDLSGTFQYRFQFLGGFRADTATNDTNTYGGPGPYGLSSMQLTARDENIWITGFPRYPHDSASGAEVVLWRRNIGSLGKWVVVDTVLFDFDSTVCYIDSLTIADVDTAWFTIDPAGTHKAHILTINGQTYRYDNYSDTLVADSIVLGSLCDSINADSTTTKVKADTNSIGSVYWYAILTQSTQATAADSLVASAVRNLILVYFVKEGPTPDTTNPTPGKFYVYDSVTMADTCTVRPSLDSTYWFAYSYFDPILQVESPIGPKLFISPVDTTDVADTTIYVRLSRGYTNTNIRAPYIRVYQGVVDSSLAGAGDTSSLYCLFTIRANDHALLPVGLWPDSEIVNGLNDSTINSRLNNGLPADTFRTWEMAVDVGGDVILRPTAGHPTIYDLQIPLKQTAVANGRVFGFGGNQPTALYYNSPEVTGYPFSGSWPASNVLRFDEHANDEIVSIMSVRSPDNKDKEFLWVFLHNAVWLVQSASGDYGFDVLDDVDFAAARIAEGIGAVSAASVVERDGVVYFLSPNMRIYAVSGSGAPREISAPIRDVVDSMFSDYATAMTECRAFILHDDVLFSHYSTDSSERDHLRYMPQHDAWSFGDFYISATGPYNPRGSVQYDIATASNGFDRYSWKMYTDSACAFYKADEDDRSSVSDAWGWQSPYVGTDTSFVSALSAEIVYTVEAAKGGRVRFVVYDMDGDSLTGATDTIGTTVTGTGTHSVRKSFAIGKGMDRYVSLRVWFNRFEQEGSGETLDQYECDFKIHEIRFAVETAGPGISE